ncbi:hypothetical protein K461DRAFT_274749 [Myriangium duriaei CBS 260.36]|uniref:Reverse transcriptase domain-containing protein n=1 Tax=Myriangium duriaei CBS 260.36 TaxID=1168546 RepID=A0A9P4MJZ1_9PEZI|nr:hypothetical protein K461DRAFT_274749 [Myriangium duriaei CBS 260.36]
MASAVLRHVTNKKLAKLEARQTKFESQYQDLVNSKSKHVDSLQYSRQLLNAIKKLGIADKDDPKLANISLFLTQAQFDASVPSDTLLEWQTQLEHLLNVRRTRYEYASLFGKLVTEWLENPNDANKQLAGLEIDETAMDVETESAEFNHVGRKEMHEQRKVWEQFAFSDRDVDPVPLHDYLTALFGESDFGMSDTDADTDVDPDKDRLAVTPLDELRKGMAMQISPLDSEGLKKTIQGLLKSDLFAGPKRAALLDLKERSAVLDEMVDVLNIELKTLQDWQWEEAGVPVVLRRQVNGKYRFFMDEEIHQALLLHYVGSSIASHLKILFRNFYIKARVTKGTTAMTEEQIKRRAYFLQQIRRENGSYSPRLNEPSISVVSARAKKYHNTYFLMQMPDSIEDGVADYSGEDNNTTSKNPMEIKQSLLEDLTADMHLRLEVHKQFCVLQSDFKWFGPSLPHNTILTVLKFFGLPKKLLSLCRAFLKVPIVFAQDGPGSDPVTRKAGVPMSHVLSDTMSEAVLFCLDVAVNKATEGGNLIRFHDDLWFWGDSDQCKVTWSTINEFCRVTGLELNMEKTGSVNMGTSTSINHSLDGLPEGAITWGFLKLDPQEHRWVVDRVKVDAHIDELRHQLGQCRSTFAFVQAWNAYVGRFFVNNFARPANCHGPAHLQSVLETFQYIQQQLFPSGSVTTHLMDKLKARFGVDDIPAGFLYFPTELGGLNLRNLFLPLMSRARAIDESLGSDKQPKKHDHLSPEAQLEWVLSQERHNYDVAKTHFEREKGSFLTLGGWKHDGWKPADADTFFSFEEYQTFRDELSEPLSAALQKLREQPPKVSVHISAESKQALREVAALLPEKRGWNGNVVNQLLIALYGPEIIQRFGSLCIADRELLPVGLVNVLRGEKVRWAG